MYAVIKPEIFFVQVRSGIKFHPEQERIIRRCLDVKSADEEGVQEF